ncbi:glutamate-5-semialdehyde dehydrogenase [Actinoplanes oblitus]|uniref:Gamma-glutamyl phosphate reductase n=1 Tax=Actinoplanes oblitus TaxID=3040509 RepID=A0ABY8WV44_9ACTN|nr:glutamate-5-semialdehyde dehydrogenase [Actinoplanes oblitus]WIM99840.1 glutamate-5-semialdehyde dehydrogenase [Actinoplanes oblitus]
MIDEILDRSRRAVRQGPPVGDDGYRRYCLAFADEIKQAWPAVLAANAQDVAAAAGRGLAASLLDLIRLRPGDLPSVIDCAEAVAAEAAGLGSTTAEAGAWGIRRRYPRPLGVILMVHEARPLLTAEAALLPVAAGNAVLVHGGPEITGTARVLGEVARTALAAAGLPAGLVTMLEPADRATLRHLLTRADAVDAVLPRESRALIDYCRSTARPPVIASGRGFNHLYVHGSADPVLAAAIVLDSKAPNPSMCNSLQVVLADRAIAADLLDGVLATADANRMPITVRADPALGRRSGSGGWWRVEELTASDFGREFLTATVGFQPVDGLEQAIEHIHRYGSAHTDGVVTGDDTVARRFVEAVDSAAVVVNGSLRMHDAPTLGWGRELTLSSGRTHVRGPVTIGALLTHSWVIEAGGGLRDVHPAGSSAAAVRKE